jgi:arginyl-tRNA synthetase
MENLIRKKINETLYKLVDNKELLSELTFDVEVPKDSKNGDFATNVAMKLASMLKKSPRAIAEEIKLKIGDSFFEKIEVAGPGFINFFVSKSFFYDFLLKIIENQNNLMSDIGSGKKVQVEFVSANPTGPLHIGHGRGAAYGDSLAEGILY